jgi:hypothetical protein
MKTTPTPPIPMTCPMIYGAEDDPYSTFVVHTTARSGESHPAPASPPSSAATASACAREEACEREREEEAHSENEWRMSVLQFYVAGKARPKMGSVYGSSVIGHLELL